MTDENVPQEQNYQEQVLRYEYVLNALSDIGDELCRVSSFESQLKSLLHLLMGTLGVSKGGIFIFGHFKESLTLKCSWKLSKKSVVFTVSSEIVENLDKMVEPFTLPFAEFHQIPELQAAFAGDDLSYASILRVREKLIGALVVGQKLKKTPFSEKEVSFLTTLSRNIAVAINNFFLLSELRDTNKQLDDKIQEVSVLYQATQMIASELQLQNLLDMAMNATVEISEVKRGSIFLFEEEHNHFTLRADHGENDGLPETILLSDSAVCSRVLEQKEPIITRMDADPPIQELGEFDLRVFGRYFLIVPIVHQGELLGLMHLCEKTIDGEFTDRDLRLIKVFALQLGVAVKNAQLYEQAITDGMTKLYLHRYFKQRLFDEIKRAARFKRNLAIVMIDVDHFKKFNDSYGHQLGDEVLRRVAVIMRRAVRTHDLPVRYGGEEFALVLPETDMVGAMAVAERVRRSVEADHLESQGKTIKVTASFGVAVFPDSALEMETLIKAADSALYVSKENGRNRVTPAPQVHPPFPPQEDHVPDEDER
jgi:diguanylate cyclase (GGDEF)-like protein